MFVNYLAVSIELEVSIVSTVNEDAGQDQDQAEMKNGV